MKKGRRASSVSIFSIGPISLKIDPEDYQNAAADKAAKTKTNDPVNMNHGASVAGGGGGWSHPNMVKPGVLSVI